MGISSKTIVKQAAAWIGKRESNGSHKAIIDVYNAHKPLARGYMVTYSDAWCATFVSAVAIKCGATKIIPTECSCNKMIELFKKLGCWVENDAYSPKVGDIIFYDWEDSGSGDNKGVSDHVGIVEKNNGKTLTIIEGNINNAVGRRYIAVNGRFIRGYGVPKYEEERQEEGIVTITLKQLYKGCEGEQVKSMQQLLIAKGYSCGSYGADGDFGSGTHAAVVKFQKARGLVMDGICGANTWNALLGA